MAGKGVVRQGLEITAVDDAILYAVYTFPLLTTEKLLRLRYSQRSLTCARGRFRRLFEAGYLQRGHAPPLTPCGKAPFAYRLSRKGYLDCQERGLDGGVIPHRARHENVSYPALCHAVAINEVLIAAAMLAEKLTSVELTGIKHEQQLKRADVRVAAGRSAFS